jgi:hypothetical protein
VDELHKIFFGWQGPIMIGGDFILSRFVSDKNNARINHRFANLFNDWVNKWGLIELDLANRKYTWANNQGNLVLAKLDIVFVSTSLEANFPLIRIVCLG